MEQKELHDTIKLIILNKFEKYYFNNMNIIDDRIDRIDIICDDTMIYEDNIPDC